LPEGDEASEFHAVLRPDGRPDHFDVIAEPNWIWYRHVRTLQLAEESWRALSLAGLKRGFTSIATRTSAAGPSDEAAAEDAARRAAGAPPLSRAALDAMLTKPTSELDPSLRALATTSTATPWPGIRPMTVWTDAQVEAASKTGLELQHFAEDVAADGGRLVIMYVPDPLQIGPRECTVGRAFDRVDRGIVLPPDSGVQAWLRDVTARNGIEFLDPSDAMRTSDQSQPERPPFYLRADCHWSEAGHDYIANFLAEWYNTPSNPRNQR